MIKVARMSLASIPFENVFVLTRDEWLNEGIPDFFEDSQIVLKAKDGIHVFPDYKINFIQLRKTNKPCDACYIKRVLIDGELNFADCYYIDPKFYNVYDIPQIFRLGEQFTFWTKTDGIVIVPDYAVVYVKMR